MRSSSVTGHHNPHLGKVMPDSNGWRLFSEKQQFR
jgi:hypothetical protein